MRSIRKIFKRMAGGGDLYMTGLDKSAKNIRISTFTPGNLEGLAFWVKADKTSCKFSSVQDYVKTVSPTIGENILKQYGTDPNQSVIVGITNLVKTGQEPNSLMRLEVDTTGRTRFPTFVSEPEKLDAISIQDMIDPTNLSQRKEKLSTKDKIVLSSQNMTVYTISTNITVTYNDNLKMLLVSVTDFNAPVTDFSEIIVFSRKLSEEENELMEGYLAYKRNDQYLLKLDHPYLPLIESMPFIKMVASELSETELHITTHMEDFDNAVQKYKDNLPAAELLDKAAALKDKAVSALKQISIIRQNLVKGALLARKQKTQTVGAVFNSIQKLTLYSEPFTPEILDAKLADFKGIVSELDAYMASLENVDGAVETAVEQNTANEQIKKRNDAISADKLKDEKNASEAKKAYEELRAKVGVLDTLGKNNYNAMYVDFSKRMASNGETLNYYHSSIISKWNMLLGSYKELDTMIRSGEWLTYDAALNPENKTTMRGEAVFHTEYTDPYYKSIQNVYEKIRNQIVEGDIVYIHDETDYIMAMYKTFQKRLTNKEIAPVCKNLFVSLFKDKITQLIKYEKVFIKLYVVLSDATADILSVLKLNKRYKTSKMKLEKQYPIPVIYDFKDGSTEVTYVRKVNKHDYSLSMIEYVVTNKDGTIKYRDADSLEAEFLFPSIENVYKNKGDTFFTKKLQFYDDSGILLFKKYVILKPYSKTENILDSISKTQVLPKYFHLVNGLFEIPRDSENGIYEMRVDSPQMPIILPKYAMADGKFFICVNVGAIPIVIKIPGFEEDVHDLIGPDEVCMYIYTGVAASTTTFYGRVQWLNNRLPYDTLYNVPRTSLCCKLTDLSKYVFMRTEKLPVFDSNGFLVEAVPDENSCVYNIDDIYRACAYKVTIGPEMKISDLEVNLDWGEQGVPGTLPTKFTVVEEESSNLAVFCNPKGIPAMDEFGFARYVQSPLLQINDKIVTRSSTGENMEVTLKTDIQIVQYGLMRKEDVFNRAFRSNFVKPFVPEGATGSVPMNTFVFVNSIGYPLVSPSNEYIQVENFIFEPPFYVKYTENLVTEYTFIPEDGNFFVPSKTILNIKTFPNLGLKNPEEVEAAEVSEAIKILSYRYITGAAFIQFTITQLQTDVGTCDTLRKDFSGISETVDMLNECIRDITSMYDDYKSYATSITGLETRDLIADTSNDEKMLMNTFDLKMKNILNKVYKIYTDGKKPVAFFKSIVKKIEKIRKEIKELEDVKSIEIVKSITNIQTIDQNQSILKGGAKNTNLTAILNTCSAKKVEFDGILNTLRKNLTNVPKDLNELEGWVNSQEILIDNANGLYKEIIDLDNVSTTEVFTQQLINNIETSVKKMEENVEKLKALVQYKKKIALWLEIYPDYAVQKEYSDKTPVPTTVVTLKGYMTKFLPFEELENPLIKRDWYALPDTDILSASTQARIRMNIVEPMKTFIEKNKDLYTNYDIIVNPPDPQSLQREDEEGLKKIVEESDKRTNEHILAVVDAEVILEPIFKEYDNVRSDLRIEIQKILNTTATDIQGKWLDCTGKRTAIQTNITLLQPYLTEEQMTRVNKINRDVEGLFSSDKLATIDEIQRSLKVSDYYANINYLKMLEMNTNWSYTSSMLSIIQNNLSNIQSDMESLQSDVLVTIQKTIQTGRDEIKTLYDTKKGRTSDGASLKNLTMTMDPKILQVLEQQTTDISTSIGLLNKMTSLKNELKT